MIVEYMSLMYCRLLLLAAELVVRANDVARETVAVVDDDGAAAVSSPPLFCLLPLLVSVSDLRRCANASDWRRRRRRATSSSSFTVPGEFTGPRLRFALIGVDGAEPAASLSCPPAGASKKLSSKSPSVAIALPSLAFWCVY